MSIWRELIHVEYLGAFINTDKGCCYKTNDIYSSIDEYYYDGKKSWAIRSHRLREFTYARVETKSGKGSIVLWHKQRRYMSPEFNKVYYLPFQRCFMGVNSNRVVLFSANPEEEKYLFEETCASVFVSGRFFFYSLNGVKWGLWDSKVQLKIEPFMQFEEIKEGSLNHTWTDEFFPVCHDKHFYFMDCHGNCFCKTSKSVRRYKNVLQSGNNLYGLSREKDGGIVPILQNKEESKHIPTYLSKQTLNEIDINKEYFEIVEDMLCIKKQFPGRTVSYLCPNAYGDLEDVTKLYRNDYFSTNTKMFSYYAEVIPYVPVSNYFRRSLTLYNYTKGSQLKDSFFNIKDEKTKKYGLFNEETDEIVAEPIYDDVRCSGDGFALTYGRKTFYLNELGVLMK